MFVLSPHNVTVFRHRREGIWLHRPWETHLDPIHHYHHPGTGRRTGREIQSRSANLKTRDDLIFHIGWATTSTFPCAAQRAAPEALTPRRDQMGATSPIRTCVIFHLGQVTHPIDLASALRIFLTFSFPLSSRTSVLAIDL